VRWSSCHAVIKPHARIVETAPLALFKLKDSTTLLPQQPSCMTIGSSFVPQRCSSLYLLVQSVSSADKGTCFVCFSAITIRGRNSSLVSHTSRRVLPTYLWWRIEEGCLEHSGLGRLSSSSVEAGVLPSQGERFPPAAWKLACFHRKESAAGKQVWAVSPPEALG